MKHAHHSNSSEVVQLLKSLTPEQLALGSALGIFAAGMCLAKTTDAWVPWVADGARRLFLLRRNSGPGIYLSSEWLSDQARQRHTHIVGATGSGKTVAIEHLLFSDLARGYGALVIDPKGDREFYDRVRDYCSTIGRAEDLCLLSATYPDESVLWNPCGLGNVSELQSKFYNSAIYNEPHYAKACEAGLLKAFNQLTTEQADGFTVTHLVAVLEEFAKASKDKTIEGLFFDLFNLSQGEWREILMCSGNPQGRREISLLDITRQNKILFVHLPTESRAVQSGRIGRLLTQELMTISGMRKTNPEIRSDRPFSVFIDEFDAFATESIATFINKGRSSDFMIHMAHQTLSDLNRVSPDFKGQIMGNCNVRLIFRQDDPDDAETWSRVFGTKRNVKHTAQTQAGIDTGMGTSRETREFRITPDEIKELRVGRCIFYVKTDARLKKLKIKKPITLETKESKAVVSPVATRGIGDIESAKPKIRFEEVDSKGVTKIADQQPSLKAYERLKRSLSNNKQTEETKNDL